MFHFQWQRNEKCSVYVVYRWLVAAFYTFSFINSVLFSIVKGEAVFMFIYLSRWNLFATMISTLLGAFLVTQHFISGLKSTHRNLKILKFYWFLSNNTVVFADVISCIYWTLLYRPGHNDLNNYLVHATNSIILLIDLFVIRHPHCLSHFVYPMTCGVFYMLFTIVYTFAGGIDVEGNNFVYPILDWKNRPEKSMLVGITCVTFLGLVHIIVCFIHQARNKFHQHLSAVDGKTEIIPQKLPFVNYHDLMNKTRN